MNTKLKSILTILGIYAGSIFLAVVFSPLGKFIDEDIIGIYCGGGIFIFLYDMFGSGCKLQGFIYFYIFWLAVSAFTFLKQKIAWAVFIVGTIFFWMLHLLFFYPLLKYGNDMDIREIGGLIAMLIFFVSGYTITVGVKKIKDISKNK